ncbi:MAG: hypothetical protein ACP6KW_12375 [Candidatus Thorarchaeota archaeon]
MKYGKPLIVSFFAIVPMAVMFTVFSEAGWIILLYPTLAIVGTLIGVALAPVFLWVYKKYMGRNHLFSIQELSPSKQFTGMLKGLFPALMATNFSLLLIFDPLVMSHPLFQGYYTQWSGIIFLFFNLGALLQVPSFALFSAAWAILDSGIVATDKAELEDMSTPIELESAGGFYLSFLKGYAGISVILTLYQFTFNFLDTYGSAVHFSAIFVLLLLPLILTLWVIPAIVVVSATYGKRQSFILGFAKRFGIKNDFEAVITKTHDIPS